jgi:hypothetical protein
MPKYLPVDSPFGLLWLHRCARRPRVKAPRKQGMLMVGGVGDPRSEATLAQNFSVENWKRQEERKRAYKEKRKRAYKKEERWYLNSRAQPPRSGDCDSAWTSFLRKRGTEVDYQVAAHFRIFDLRPVDILQGKA